MAIPKLIPLSHIEDLEKEQHDKFRNMVEAHGKSTVEGNPAKQRWLAIYARTLSLKLACEQADVPYDTYRRWRSKDATFCRAINDCILASRDELVGATLVRATGYLRHNPDTGEIETDATGKPIYYGGSDTLAKALLGMDQDEVKRGEVNVIINIGAMRGQEGHSTLEAETPDPDPIDD